MENHLENNKVHSPTLVEKSNTYRKEKCTRIRNSQEVYQEKKEKDKRKGMKNLN